MATLCLCTLSVITYYSLAIAWEVFWASRRSPSLLDPSAGVVLTDPESDRTLLRLGCEDEDSLEESRGRKSTLEVSEIYECEGSSF